MPRGVRCVFCRKLWAMFVPRSAVFGPHFSAIVTGLVVACSGCAVTQVSPKPVEATPSVALREASPPAGQASGTTSVVQAQHLEVSEGVKPATEQSPAAAATEQSEAVPTPLPSPALTLDQAINLCLTNDPKIHAGLEVINQANADAWTASLRPNPVVNVNGTLLPLGQAFTAAQPGGRRNSMSGSATPSTGFCLASARRRWPVRRWAFACRNPITPTSCGNG